MFPIPVVWHMHLMCHIYSQLGELAIVGLFDKNNTIVALKNTLLTTMVLLMMPLLNDYLSHTKEYFSISTSYLIVQYRYICYYLAPA